MKGEEDLGLMLSFEPQAVRDGQPYSICVLLDTSASMELSGKLDGAKAACLLMWESLRPDDRLCVVCFDSKTRVCVDWLQKSRSRRRDLQKALETLQPGGVTLLEEGMRQGARCLAEHQHHGPGFLVIISDGDPTNSLGAVLDDWDPLLALSGQLAEQGITISAVGLGDAKHFNHSFLCKLADRGCGSFCYSDDPMQLGPMMQDRLAWIGMVVAAGAKMELELVDGELKWLTRMRPDYCRLSPLPMGPNTWHVALGNIYRPESIFMCGVRTAGPPFGEGPGQRVIGSAQFSAHIGGAMQRFDPIPIALEFSDKPRVQSQFNGDVEQLRVEAELRMSAELLGQISDPKDAVELLEHQAVLADNADVPSLTAAISDYASIIRETGVISPHATAALVDLLRSSAHIGVLAPGGSEEGEDPER